MRQLVYTFGFILLLLAVFLGVWWTQSYRNAVDTLRDQVEAEMNLLISDSYLIKTFQIIRAEQPTFPGKDYFRWRRPQGNAPIIMMGKREAELRREADRTTLTISERDGKVTEVEIVVDETGFSLGQLPEDIRDSISRKFSVRLALPPGTPPGYLRRDGYNPAPQKAEDSGAPVVWARQVNKHHNEHGTMYYLLNYRAAVLLGMLPEFLFGLILFGATGFAFASAYRNLYEQDQQLKQKDALVANVAHELKTPIATVGVALEALNVFGADADPARRREYLAIGQAELDRLDQMADRAIDSLQGGNLRQRLRPEETNLSAAAHDAWRGLALRYQLPEEALTITTAGDVRARVDRHYWHHLVYNLLDNACKYGGRPLQVAVAVRGKQDSVVFEITDNGPGIPPNERENVFDRFYRIQRPGEGHSVKGHGLGLSFVRQVAAAHEGAVTVDNAPGAGARFLVEMPR